MSGQSRGALFDSDDIVPVLIEGVLRLVWWVVRTVFALVVFAVRVPALAVPAAVLVAVGVTYGRNVALWAAVALVVALVVWRLLRPRRSGGGCGPGWRRRGRRSCTGWHGGASPPGSGWWCTTTARTAAVPVRWPGWRG